MLKTYLRNTVRLGFSGPNIFGNNVEVLLKPDDLCGCRGTNSIKYAYELRHLLRIENSIDASRAVIGERSFIKFGRAHPYRLGQILDHEIDELIDLQSASCHREIQQTLLGSLPIQTNKRSGDQA